ncbi:MAG: hypothetical protein GY857_12885 [Desulfobacula sp.]|nr:hypothetical protein [Desulfobacula sp.]
MKAHIKKNITSLKNGNVMAYALDDEISLGHFTSPGDVDIQPLSLLWFQRWLEDEYITIDRLNEEWDSRFNSFSAVSPQSFEEIRKHLSKRNLSGWNLSPWMDFRRFMDFQFSSVLSDLVRYSNSIDPETPTGFVGGQAPSVWGGYDYALLSRSVQWMEAYDIHATNEILRSFWNKPRQIRMQTFFASKNPKLDSWFLWYYMLHGNQGVVAWPKGWFKTIENKRDISPKIKRLSSIFQGVQGEPSRFFVSPSSELMTDPIGIYYSHPSIQAGWVMDALVHKKSWVNRSSTLDNKNQTKGILRKVWCKTLEDLGYQYDFINYRDVEEGIVDLSQLYKVIILPKTICLSKKEAAMLEGFVKNGGVIIADYLCGVMDEHGKVYDTGILDSLFGIVRNDEPGYLNGNGLTEIDGEKYERPFLERFTLNDGAERFKKIVVFEIRIQGKPAKTLHNISKNVKFENQTGLGKTYYLNLSPLEYWSMEKRSAAYGENWRNIVGKILLSAGLSPRLVVREQEKKISMIESLFWKKGDDCYLGLIKNPSKTVEKQDKKLFLKSLTDGPVNIELIFKSKINLKNIITGKSLGNGLKFNDEFRPWEGSVYKVDFNL